MSDEEIMADEQSAQDEEAQEEEQETQTESVVATFIGGRNFLPGVPARDMGEGEWEALDDEVRETALNLGLYEVNE